MRRWALERLKRLSNLAAKQRQVCRVQTEKVPHDSDRRLHNEAKKAPDKIAVDARLILDVPAGSQPQDCGMIQAAGAVTNASGVVPERLAGGCANTNMAIARGIPGVCLTRGVQESGTHALAELFDPKAAKNASKSQICCSWF